MTKRHTSGYRRIVAAGALVVAVMGVATPALADEPVEQPADEPVEQPVEPADEPVTDVPATGEAVPPVVAVGQPPVPARHAPLAAEPPAPAESAALVDTASAVLDLIGDLL